MSDLITVNNLVKYFKVSGGTLHAVDGVSFSIREGKTLGVVGESGCGKSTLGRVILHLNEPTSGEIVFDGEDISVVDHARLKQLCMKMQIIFQDPFSSLNPKMAVEDIIAEPLEIFNVVPKDERRKEVAALMDTVGLSKRLARSFPHELDGGRRQRIGIARALALKPKFIVCDEPVSALDVSIQAQILNLMQDLQQETGLTYLFITHNMSVVKHISNDIAVMYLGKIVEMCPSEELFKNPVHPYTKALLSAIPVPIPGARKNRMILKGEIVSPINPKPGCRFAPRCPDARPECFNTDPSPVEISPGHTVSCILAGVSDMGNNAKE